MPGPFERGFSPFGRQVPLRGQAPAPLAAPAVVAPVMARPTPPPAPSPVPPQSVPGPSAPIRVYKKGEAGAPPCPVCRG